MSREPRVFLTAEWRYLVMLNYEVKPAVLEPLTPAGVELDAVDGRTFVSIVGFLFRRTRVLGLPIPFHVNFEEVNLRFYVRRHEPDGWRRGVVFIKELVPRWAISAVARGLYNENYHTVPMSHVLDFAPPPDPSRHGAAPATIRGPGLRNVGKEAGVLRQVSYAWRYRGQEYRIDAAPEGEGSPAREGSLEQFITEHYWGYSRQRSGRTLEYQVEHPPWRVWSCPAARFTGDPGLLYGPAFAPLLSSPPAFSLLADGSPISVRFGTME